MKLRLPLRGSIRWLGWGGVYLAVLWPLLVLNRYVVLGLSLRVEIVLRSLLLALLLTAVTILCGWLGARWLFLFTSIGIAAGLFVMFYQSGDASGWQDLISFLSFLFVAAIGFGVGVVAEIVIALRKQFRKKGRGDRWR